MMKKLLALLSLVILASALTACTSSNPKKVEANNAKFSQQVDAETEGTGDLTKNFAAGS